MSRWLLALLFAFGSVTLLTGCPAEEEPATPEVPDVETPDVETPDVEEPEAP